jgi:hypothetical protein
MGHKYPYPSEEQEQLEHRDEKLARTIGNAISLAAILIGGLIVVAIVCSR